MLHTETGLARNRAVSELTRSSHGDLKQYVPIASQAVKEDPEFFAHLVAWNEQHGQVRDSKLALPLIGLTAYDRGEFFENALAHLARRSPRELVKVVRFAKTLSGDGWRRSLHRLVERYLRVREENWPWWERTALQHRHSMKELYALFHVKPNAMADLILFKNQAPSGTVFADVRTLSQRGPLEIASIIIERRVPFLVATGALGKRMREPDILLAVIERMTPSELVTNAKALNRLGVQENAALRAAFEQGMQRIASSKKVSLKTTQAAEAVIDEKTREQLRGAQEKQLKEMSVEGRWLILADRSGSMEAAIEASRYIASTLTAATREEVHLVFFNESPTYINVSGSSYDEILAHTRHITAGGGTSIGCGLAYALEKNLEVDGIVVVSDAAENRTPAFSQVYARYAEKFNKDVPVYLYWLHGSDPGEGALIENMAYFKQDLQVFDLRSGKVDYYSLPNLVKTMRVNKYSLSDEILGTPLLTLDEVFKKR